MGKNLVNQKNWQRLVKNSQPHEVFRTDMSSYSTPLWGATFLPNAMRLGSRELFIYDGAELFSDLFKIESGIFLLNRNRQPINIYIYTYPKGVMAEERKRRVDLAANEICAFFEIDSTGSIEMKFKFGKKFTAYIVDFSDENTFASNAEEKIWLSKLTDFKAHFKKRITHENFMKFAFETIGLKAVNDLDALEATLLEAESFFKAGEADDDHKDAYAHGDIAKEALKNAGFTENEIEIIYYGNWLRDYSQIITGSTIGFNKEDRDLLQPIFKGKDETKLKSMAYMPSQNTWVEILKIVAVKEFVHAPLRKQNKPTTEVYATYLKEFEKKFGTLNKDVLGLYRPEEHIDNPKGLEDESIFGDERLQNPVFFNYTLPTNQKEKRTLYAGTQIKSLQIDETTLLKNFIKEDIDKQRPSSFSYLKEQLQLAVLKGKNKEGLRHFGAALHVFEDYFSHTNFVEISLIKCGYSKVHPWVQLDTEIDKMTDGAKKAAKIPITTGYFGPADTIASLTSVLAEKVFPMELKAYETLEVGERTFVDALILTILEDLSIKQNELEKEGQISFLSITIPDLLKYYNRYLKFRDGWIKQKSRKGPIGWLIRLSDKALNYISGIYKFFFNVIVSVVLKITEVAIKEGQTILDKNYGTDPSHTQLAKDPFDHPLNPLAGKLASIAVEDIAKKMKQCYYGYFKIDELIKHIDNTYFVHPSNTSWQDKHVKEWALRNKPAVKKAESKTAIHHHHNTIKPKLDEFKDFIEILKNPPTK
jgi:hypothetical protein